MNKLTIIHPFNPVGRRVGGIGTFIKGIIKYIPDDVSVALVGLSNEGDALPLGEWVDVDIAGKRVPFYSVMVESDENQRQRLPLAIRFTWHLFMRRIDLRGNDLFFHRLEPAILFLNNRNRKFFVFHNDIDKFLSPQDSEVLWAKIPQVYLLLEKLIYKFADKVLTVNGNSLEFYRQHYARNADKFGFIPTWVDEDIFKPLGSKLEEQKHEVGKTYGIPADKNWILFVGRLQRQKAPEKLVEVLALLGGDEQLVIVGDGNLRENIEQLVAEHALGKRVHFLNTMDQKQLRGLYQVSDVFLLTSNFEGMPMCVLEAQACGLPVVCTPVGEVARVVRNFSGIITEDHEVNSIVDAVRDVLSRRSKYTVEHCLAAVDKFTASRVVCDMFEVFYGKDQA